MLMRVIGLTVVLLLLAACGQDFSGNYQGAGGTIYSFKNNGKVTVREVGKAERIMPFTREDNILMIGGSEEGDTLTLIISEDGSLSGTGMRLRKIR